MMIGIGVVGRTEKDTVDNLVLCSFIMMKTRTGTEIS